MISKQKHIIRRAFIYYLAKYYEVNWGREGGGSSDGEWMGFEEVR